MSAADRVVEDGRECPLDHVDLTATDLAVSLGGDGTFLRLASITCDPGVPLLGINFGRLGYLLNTPPDHLPDAIERFWQGEAEIQQRALLDVSVSGELRPLGRSALDGDNTHAPPPTASRRSWRVLNEAVVEKTVPGHMVHIESSVNDEPLVSYRADGVLVATPTGSTAYNLSARGPILSPSVRAVVVTPIAPHMLFDRPLVLGPSEPIELVLAPPRPAVLVIDGVTAATLVPGETVACRLGPRPARLVRFGPSAFFDVLRDRFQLADR
jgi:NAD+ kinase